MDVLVFFLLNVGLLQAQKYNYADYYVNLIEEANRNALAYQLPTNAKEYYSNETREKYGDYDFVVIGAGSAGTVVANRLSEVQNWTVLLLEAGKHGNDICDIPKMMLPLQLSEYNWGYNSTPQKHICQGNIGKVCTYARGKGLGGTTLINGLYYVRGHKNDFNIWAKLAGSKRWGYKRVLQYFKKSENFVLTDLNASYDSKFHGTNGPLRVEQHLPRSPLVNVFLEANKQIGFDTVDYNSNKIGASITQFNTKHGRRFDGAKAFLKPIRSRINLKILPESYVTKIQFNHSTNVATKVDFTHKGKSYFVEANKEIIVSAGPFGSPQILMRSGIGPKKHLKNLNIDVIADLGVGNTLRDHAVYYGMFIGTNYTVNFKNLKTYVEEFLRGEGPLTITTSGPALGFYESSYTNGTGIPDIELIFNPSEDNVTSALFPKALSISDSTFKDVTKDINPTESFTIFITNVHPRSVGTFRLKSSSPYDYPLIDVNALSDDKDKNILYDGVQLVLKLLETEAFKKINATLHESPLTSCKNYEYLSKEYWFCAFEQLGLPNYHPVATCAMGTNPKKGAVVDSKLKVFGIKNLRVADTSVIPQNMACHTSAPGVMIGEQLGDIVKEAYNIIPKTDE